MDVGISSIGISNFKDDISHNEAEVEAAVLADQEIQEQEIDADLEKAFDGLCGLNTSESEIETESEDDDEIGNSHNTRSYVSQQDDFSSAFSEHKRNLSDSISRDDELENRLRKVDSYSGTGHSYANSSEKHSHFVPTSQSYDEYEGTSVAEHTNYNLAEPDYHKDNKKYASDVNSSEDYKNSVSVNPAFSAAMTNSAVDLQEEYRKLCIIYETTCQELTQLKREEINYRKETDQTIRTLKLNMDLIESEKKKLTSALQESQNLVSSYLQDKNTLLGKVTALESQLSSMTKVKEEFQSKLEGSEVTIQLLEKQLCEFNRSGNMSRLRDHHNSILEEMKLRHEKDILHYRQNIDELQVELNSKVQETEELTSKNSELYHNYQQLQIEKAEWVNKMSSELEKAQRKCQQYLELGTIEEVNRLKLQVQRLEEEKSNIERENSSLRDEIKSLKIELNTAEALQKLTFSKPDASTGRQRDLNLHQELESSLKNVRSLRSEKHSLKKQLKDTENELENLRKRADLFESQFIESEKKVNELEEKLKSFSSNESMSIQLYEKKINSLESELSDLKINLHDTTEKLKQTVLSEKILHESNEEMQKKMTELVQKHIADKIQAVEMCREQLLELHENALQKEKDKIIIKANAELKDICFKYENKISEMQKGMKALNDGLYDSKNQYLALYKENQNLQEKFDEISKPKEREEIENEIRLDYERKLNEIKAQLIKQNEEYLTEHFKAELEKAEIEWTSKKMADIKVFVENTKQRLDDEFQSCLQKEQTEFQKKLETEKKRLYKEYEENMENLKKKFEEQKTELNAKLNKDIQNEWGKKINKLNENHEKEINSIQFQFDNKLQQMENEIKSLKERLSVKSNENEEVQKLKQEFMLQQEKLQREKDAFVSAEIVLNENIKKLTESENKLHDKIKKYQRHVASVKKHYQEKINKLQAELSDFQHSNSEKQKQLFLLKEKCEKETLDLINKLTKQNSFKSSMVQTEEELVPKQKVLILENKFFKCLNNISDGIRQYIDESKKRNAEKIESALLHYHQQVSSKLLKGLSKDIHSYTPTFILPHTSARHETISKETFESSNIPQSLTNANLKTSTPNLNGKLSEQIHKTSAQNSNKDFTNMQNSNPQTSVKSIHKMTAQENVKSRSSTQTSITSTFKTPKLDAFSSGDSLFTEKIFFNREGSNNSYANINKKDFEAIDRFEDISYDFLSLNLPSGRFDPSKMPEHKLHGDDHNKHSDQQIDSFPVKLFPS